MTDLSSQVYCSQRGNRAWTHSCQALVMHDVQKDLNTLPVTARSCDVSQALYTEIETLQTLTCLFRSWPWFLWPTYNADGIFAWIIEHCYEDNDYLLTHFNGFIYKLHFPVFWARKQVILSHLDRQEVNISALLWISSSSWNLSPTRQLRAWCSWYFHLLGSLMAERALESQI